ncbi:MAG: archease [Labilithrix sp.]|nr:archease [Labilithrix sp.]
MKAPTASRHRFVEHTGELELRLEAPDLASLLEEAARALAEVMAEDAAGPPTRAPEHLELAASDRESLFVDWLNELVYRAEVDKCVFVEVRVARATDRKLEAIVRGREPSSPRTAVKAATWHRLRVSDTPEGLEATVVLDV